MEMDEAKPATCVRWYYRHILAGGYVRDAKVVRHSASGRRVLVEWQKGQVPRFSWVSLESLVAVSR